MEPMTLGSPSGTPAQSPGTPGSSSAYLPGFLLGEATTPARLNMSNHPDSSRYSATNMTSPVLSYGAPTDYRLNRQKAMFANAQTPGSPRIGGDNQTGGPPTRGLFDSLEPTSQMQESFTTTTTNNNNNNNISMSRNQRRSIIDSPTNDSFFFDNSINIGNTESSQGLLRWITVFGFSPNALNTVLSHISNRVRIVDKHPAPHPQSNWIHLKCATEQEAQRALACNGNIVSGSIMIGVTPCLDEGVVLSPEKENRTINGSMRIFSSPNRMGHNTNDNSTNILNTPRSHNVRPLAAGFNHHMSPQSIIKNDNIPQKSTGIVTKAMEYVFGW